MAFAVMRVGERGTVGIHAFAYVHDMFAARMEMAAVRRVDGRGDVTFEYNFLHVCFLDELRYGG